MSAHVQSLHVTQNVAVCGVLFVFIWTCHSLSRNWTSSDSRWTIPTALSIIDDHTAKLDKYSDLIEQNGFYAIDCVTKEAVIRPLKSLAQCTDGHFYNFYPVGVAVLAAPEVWVIRRLAGVVHSSPWDRFVKNPYRRRLMEGDLIYTHAFVEVLIASFWVALTAVLLYFIALRFVNPARSLGIALLFAFCTPAWSTASRALWQHGGSMLLLTLALLAFFKVERNFNWLVLAGAALAFSLVIRPTNLVFFVAACLYLLKSRNQKSWLFAVAAVPVLALFVAWSYSVYREPVAPYYLPQRPGSNSLALGWHFIEALAGNLISPGRGLFIYVPVFLLAIPSLLHEPAGGKFSRLRPFLAGALAAHWILISTFEDWWAGYSFGPRYFSDVTPVFVLFLIPVVQQPKSKRTLALFCVLAIGSLAIHYRGANSPAVFDWNRTPVSIDKNPGRVWDWSDIAFFR